MSNVYTVSEVNAYIKKLFTQNDVLSHIYMKGEISNCKYHTSGHIYFTVKDASGQMACVMFAGNAGRLRFRLEEGQSVVVLGSISVYERDGKYQMYAESIQMDGQGVLYEQYEKLKRKLYEEGLFDKEHKLPIPQFAKTLGIVTASTGAAIQDIVSISKRRNPYIRLILYPAKVQGEGAYLTIIKGIKALEKQKVDVIIVGRGGGSIEDLWAFNEEAVARAIYECSIPIISSVGHETDTTISDYAADLRAPTPSAAAELAVFDYSGLSASLIDYHSILYQKITDKIRMKRLLLSQLEQRFKRNEPSYQLKQKQMQILELEEKLQRSFQDVLRRKRQMLAIYIEKMKRLSPIDKLQSGYSFVINEKDHVINSIDTVRIGETLRIEVTDGEIKAVISEISAADRPKGDMYGE